MEAMTVKTEGDTLIITVDTSKAAIDAAPPSASGKTRLVASTHGSQAVYSPHCPGLSLSLNLTAKR
jgi:hypothetical protein